MRFFKILFEKIGTLLSRSPERPGEVWRRWLGLAIPIAIATCLGMVMMSFVSPTINYAKNTFFAKPMLPVGRSKWLVLYEDGGVDGANGRKLWESQFRLSDSNLLSKLAELQGRKFLIGLSISQIDLQKLNLVHANVLVVGHINAGFRLFVNGRERSSGTGRDFLPVSIELSPTDLLDSAGLRISILVDHNLGSYRPVAVGAPYPTGFFTEDGSRGFRNYWIFSDVIKPLLIGLLGLFASLGFFLMWIRMRIREELLCFSIYSFCLFLIQVSKSGDIKFRLDRSIDYKIDIYLRIIEGLAAALVGFSYARIRFVPRVIFVLFGFSIAAIISSLDLTANFSLQLIEYLSRFFVPLCFIAASVGCISQAIVGPRIGEFETFFQARKVKLLEFAAILLLVAVIYSAESIQIIGLDGVALWHRPIQLAIVFIEGLFLFFEYKEAAKKAEQAKILSELAVKVAHDIRSPLAALEVLVGDTIHFPVEQRVLVQSVANRIQEIANDLIANRIQFRASRNSRIFTKAKPRPCLVSALLEAIIAEKCIQFRGQKSIEIELYLSKKSFGVFGNLVSGEISRAVSNTINNAVEALPGASGRVLVSLDRYGDRFSIKVNDSGSGIPEDLLNRLGRENVTFGKEGLKSGTGMGLFYAKNIIENHQGRMEIQNLPGSGASVCFDLPLVQSEFWFLDTLKLQAHGALVVVTESASLYEMWVKRFSDVGFDNIFCATSSDEAMSLSRRFMGLVGVTYLVDLDSDDLAFDGLGMIDDLPIDNRIVLVTNRFEDQSVQDKCCRLGAKILPKSLAPQVPLEIVGICDFNATEIVLIDDDKSIRDAWSFSAKRFGKRLLVFSSIADFSGSIDALDRSTPIFVDSNLGVDDRGEIASKKIHELGFTNIYIATGRPAGSVKVGPWIKAVVGKTPPWL